MTIRIKNCGLTTRETIDAATQSGASYVGFVHHASSRRHLDFAPMQTLVAYAKRQAATVAVLVQPSEQLIDTITKQIAPDFIQLHQIPNLDYLHSIQQRTHIPLIGAVAVTSAADIATAQCYEPYCAHMLLDAAEAGSGLTFDWKLLSDLQLSKPWFLAGGLNEQNVALALRVTKAPMVDVSSGIESAPGIKSPEMIAAFNKAVLRRGS